MIFQIQPFGLSFISKTLALGSLIIAILIEPNFKSYFRKPIAYFFLFCMLNMIWCFINKGQTPVQYIMGGEFLNMLGLLVLFTIPIFRLKNSEIENVIFAVGITCIIIYLTQYFLHIPLFKSEENLQDADLSMRVRMNGQCLFVLLYLKSFDNLLDKFSFKDVVVLVASLLCIFIIGFRSHIATIAVISFIFFFKKKKVTMLRLFYSVLLGLLLIGISQIEIVQYKIDQMIERNERGDNFDNKDYVRYRSFDFYVNEFPKNIGDRIFGVGLPSSKSSYGMYVQRLKNVGLIWADLGLIGLSVVLGFPAVLCIIWYGLKAFFTTVESRYSYLCYWFLFMLIASLITREIFRMGAFAVQGFVLYLIANCRRHGDRFLFQNI